MVAWYAPMMVPTECSLFGLGLVWCFEKRRDREVPYAGEEWGRDWFGVWAGSGDEPDLCYC